MLHEDEAGDAITGLQQKTHYGRPQWSQIFESISKSHPKCVNINKLANSIKLISSVLL